MTTPQPGPLGEEAVRLVEALSQWVGTHWPGAQGARGGADLPLANGSAECRVCPFCQVLSVVRHTRPEVFGHLTDASSSFVAAVRAAVESHAEHAGAGAAGRGGVERIDLDEDTPDRDWPDRDWGVAK
jgi:hypothetical protein